MSIPPRQHERPFGLKGDDRDPSNEASRRPGGAGGGPGNASEKIDRPKEAGIDYIVGTRLGELSTRVALGRAGRYKMPHEGTS